MSTLRRFPAANQNLLPGPGPILKSKSARHRAGRYNPIRIPLFYAGANSSSEIYAHKTSSKGYIADPMLRVGSNDSECALAPAQAIRNAKQAMLVSKITSIAELEDSWQ